ncbi:MAG: FAD-dependent monooxygenase [Omnitrophica WOR_2 bacterium]
MDPNIKDKSEARLPEAMRNIPDIPVLIVGGGPVGLSTSILLSHHGIRSLLVEQHPGTSVYAKARFINARTMEIFRQLGIEQAIRDIEIPHARNFILARSLAGEELLRKPLEEGLSEYVREWALTWGCTSSQEIIERVLLAQARWLEPAQIRFNTQLASFEQREEDILATLVHRRSGRVQHVRARYLIGADGAHSTVREALGIRMQGKPVLAYRVNIQFDADLSPWVGDREINMCYITNPDAVGNLYYYGGNRWKYQVFYYPDRGQRSEDFTPERCLQLIRMAVGAPELKVELHEIMPWNDAALVAERFYDRRAFLAGDAEHLMSPTGGFGMNVGIQDVHNLAWKLAAVLNGWADPALLASYETERLPVSRVMVEQMASNLDSVPGAPGAGGADSTFSLPPVQPMLGSQMHNLVFGITYDSPVIVPDGTAPEKFANPVNDYAPSARPGSRAPHVWLERAGEYISTLDLFGSDFVLLAGARGSGWCEATKSVSGSQGVPVQAFQIGPQGDLGDPDHAWVRTYGVEEDGAVLVRPDGYVAWRCAALKEEPTLEIETALQTALAKQTIQQRHVTHLI